MPSPAEGLVFGGGDCSILRRFGYPGEMGVGGIDFLKDLESATDSLSDEMC